MTDAACSRWAAVYSALSAAQPGLLGAVTARAEAQVVRLALVYALLDGKSEMDEPHLKAALALWEYCEASAVRIFGDALGDPVADEINRALQQAGVGGMTRTAIRDLFGRNQPGDPDRHSACPSEDEGSRLDGYARHRRPIGGGLDFGTLP